MWQVRGISPLRGTDTALLANAPIHRRLDPSIEALNDDLA
jgi:hypothetical protein